jgi:hypothetical protein
MARTEELESAKRRIDSKRYYIYMLFLSFSMQTRSPLNRRASNPSLIDLHGTTASQAVTIVLDILAREGATPGACAMCVGSVAFLVFFRPHLEPFLSEADTHRHRTWHSLGQWRERDQTRCESCSARRGMENRYRGWVRRCQREVMKVSIYGGVDLTLDIIYSIFAGDLLMRSTKDAQGKLFRITLNCCRARRGLHF